MKGRLEPGRCTGHRLWLRLWPLGFFAVLAVPSSDHVVFNGLPFSGPVEFLTAAIATLVSADRPLRRLLARWMDRAPRPTATVATLALAVTVAMKLVLLVSGEDRGFAACYRGIPANPTLSCERSYERWWARTDPTRVDRTLAFGPADWNLAFFNGARFSIPPDNGNLDRKHLPFEVTWRGDLVVPPGSRAALARYTGSATVWIDDRRVDLAAHYGAPVQATFDVPSGRHHVRVNYRFDDGYRIGGRRGSYATLRLVIDTPQGEIAWAAAPARPAYRAIGWMVDALTGAAGLLLLGFWITAIARSALTLLAGLVAAFAVALVPAGWLPGRGASFALLCAGLAGYVMGSRHARGIRVAAGVTMVAAMLRASLLFPSLDSVLLRSWGNDWFTYEAFARSMLETGSLEGGEPIYYFSTLSRYARFVEHALVGDSDALVTALVLILLNVSLLWSCRRAMAHRPSLVDWWFALVGGVLATVLVNAPMMVGMVQQGLSEYAAWIALPMAYALLWSPRPGTLAGGAVLGLCGLARTNLVPGLAVLSVPWRRLGDRRAWSAPLAFAALIVLVPLLHNRYYGGRWIVVSDAMHQNAIIEPREAYRIFTDPSVRATAAEGARWIVFSDGSSRVVRAWGRENLLRYFPVLGAGDVVEGWTLTLPIHGLQVLYVLLVFHVCRRRERRTLSTLAILSVPLAFLGPHIFYRVTVYYPRYIIAGYLSIALAAMWCEAATRRARVGPA